MSPLIRMLLLVAACAGAALAAPAAQAVPEPSTAYLLTIGTTPMDQRPVEGIVSWWSTPFDGLRPLTFTRIFDFGDPLESCEEAPGTLQEAVLRRAYPAQVRPFAPDPAGLDAPAGLRLDGVQVVDWSLRLVDGIPEATESVEIRFTAAQPWRPYELTWDWQCYN